MKLCLSLSLITVLLQCYPKSLIAMPAPSHLSPTQLNIEGMWRKQMPLRQSIAFVFDTYSLENNPQ